MSKLCAYKINGTCILDLHVYGVNDLNGNPAFISADTVPVDYEDRSSITLWAEYGMQTGKDYKFVRYQIMIIAATIGWSNLTASEKEIAVKWFAVGKTERDEILTLDEQITQGYIHHRKSVESRKNRAEAVMVELYNRLTWLEVTSIINDIESSGLLNAYINFGKEGTLSGDPEGIYDYLNAEANTSFANTGLLAKNYTPTGITLPDLVTKIMDILKNGNY